MFSSQFNSKLHFLYLPLPFVANIKIAPYGSGRELKKKKNPSHKPKLIGLIPNV